MKLRQMTRILFLGVWGFFMLSLCLGCSQEDGVGYGGINGPNRDHWASLFDWADSETWTDPGAWSDDKLRSFAYSGTHGHPDFFQGDPSRGSRSYVTAAGARIGGNGGELSTSNRDTAYAWAETLAVHLLYYREIESERETEKFFEFRRVYSERPNDVILSRVHKSSYLDRSMYDRYDSTALIGIFQVQPITEAAAQELIEYMFINSRIVDLGRPLSRNIHETPSSFLESIYYSYTIGGDWGICDTVVLGLARITVDKETGEISSEVEELREVSGVCFN